MTRDPSAPAAGDQDSPRSAHFRCSSCGKGIRSSRPVPVDRQVRCPSCGASIRVRAGDFIEVRVPSIVTRERGADPLLQTPDAPPFRSSTADRPEIHGYAILGEIGRGASGVVYRARHEKLERIVALKVLRVGPDGAGLLLTEARSVALINHVNIVQIFDVGDQGGTPYLALEYVPGGTLQARIEGEPQPARAAARLIETLARAVQVAHDRGLVHRDLKPANVLLATVAPHLERVDADGLYYGVPKIADFGLALRLDPNDGRGDGLELAGTPHYMAPEQVRGRIGDVGPCVDVYALGVILYELIAGRRPFEGGTLDELLRAIVDDPPAMELDGRFAHRDLKAICRKAMAKDPRHRYRTALALADDLGRFLRGEFVEARSLGLPGRTWNWSLRNPTAASLLGTAALLLCVGLPSLYWLGRQMVRLSAVQSAEQHARTVLEVWDMYSSSIDEAKLVLEKAVPEPGDGPAPKGARDGMVTGIDFDLSIGKDPDGRLTGDGVHMLPYPATFVRLLGAKLRILAGKDDGKDMVSFKVYSDYPFRRSNLSPPPEADKFAREALDRLAKQGEGASIARFDRDRLRLAYAVTLRDRCRRCHNKPSLYDAALYHDELRKPIRADWEIGETRGVLEIDRPMGQDYVQADRYLFWTHALILGCAVVLPIGGRFLLTAAGSPDGPRP